MAHRNTALRDGFAWLAFPVLMGGFVAVAACGLGRGHPPAAWGAALTVANFFVILAVEQCLPRNPAMGVFCDRQSLCDIGHGLLLTAARPPGSAASGISSHQEIRKGTEWLMDENRNIECACKIIPVLESVLSMREVTVI